ncbi:hypothetical protein B0J14DRAFT_286350 [Halenospora varia]|nr:hypothetical protein B0J14DRAFT_286350 [Halenospora varia]
MTFKIHEIPKSSLDFTTILPPIDAGYTTPFNGMWDIWKGPSLTECATRLAQWHNHDPTSLWIYATDDATGEVVGGMGWNVHETDPFAAEGPELKAYWWPEGDMKEIADQVIEKFVESRPGYMSKPHMLISYCSVHPNNRHRGAASAMMKWGLQKADELNLETFVESTDHAKGLYEAHGFTVIREFVLNADVEEPSEEFMALKKKFLPLHGWIMSRPKARE